MYQCILNVPLWNDWSTVTYSQVHGSPVLKAPSFKSLSWISAKTFAEFIQFWQNPKLRRPRTFEREILVFHWRKISYLKSLIFFLYLSFVWDTPVKHMNNKFPVLSSNVMSMYIYIYIYGIHFELRFFYFI